MITIILTMAIASITLVNVWALAKWLLGSVTIDDIQSKCVFITGCDSGFGKLTAAALASRGVQVYAGCYTESGQADWNERGKTGNTNVTGVRVDVTDRDSLQRARQYIEDDLRAKGKVLWGVVNNAGVLRGQVIHLATLEDYKCCMDVNFFGAISVNEVFLPLVKRSKGRIVNVVSILSRCSGVMEPYVASKFALGVYNDGLRRFLKDYGVHVAAIEPGFHPSSMMNADAITADLNSGWNKLPDLLRKELGPHFQTAVQRDMMKLVASPPLARFNDANNVSSAICSALLSRWPRARYVVGVDANLLYRFGPFVPDLVMDFVVRTKLSIYRTEHQSE